MATNRVSAPFRALRWLAFAILLACVAACSKEQPPVKAGFSSGMVVSMSAVQGKFQWRPDLDRYVYSETAQLEKIIATWEPEPAVSELVDCLDDLHPSLSTLDGKPVPVAVVCYQALSHTVVHEETGPNGDIAPSWAGHITPTATADQLAAAKKAWQRVLVDHTYSFL